jgi:hypothetical protein
MKAPTGHYRTILKDTYPFIRIAFTHTPMYGVTRVDNANVLKVLEQSTDQYAQYYIDNLRSGAMVTIVENSHDVDRYFSVGELYFKS